MAFRYGRTPSAEGRRRRRIQELCSTHRAKRVCLVAFKPTFIRLILFFILVLVLILILILILILTLILIPVLIAFLIRILVLVLILMLVQVSSFVLDAALMLVVKWRGDGGDGGDGGDARALSGASRRIKYF